MTAIILSIGDELILGQTVDTNSAWLSRQLAAVGCRVIEHLTVPDDQPAIRFALIDASCRCDWLIVTGGLGPTPDDLTRQALAEALNQPLEPDTQWLDHLQEYFRSRRRPMPTANAVQAMIPRGAARIDNPIGTALGIDATLAAHGGSPARPDEAASGRDRGVEPTEYSEEICRGSTTKSPDRGRECGPRDFRHGLLGPRPCRVMAFPGVPKELHAMFLSHALEQIRSSAAGAVVLTATLHTFGVGESAIAEKLGDLMDRERNPSVGTTVSNGVVSLRLAARFADRAAAQRELNATVSLCCDALGDLIYGSEDDTLPVVVDRLLKENRATIATAESCTGGLLAKLLTDIPGSSAVFHHGWITYSNSAKTELLGIAPDLLQCHGAVSEPVVSAMAAAARQRSGSTYALAISGVAGPDGGTPDKPVGTVCIALAHPDGTSARTFNFRCDREMIRDRSARMALTMLRYQLLGRLMPF